MPWRTDYQTRSVEHVWSFRLSVFFSDLNIFWVLLFVMWFEWMCQAPDSVHVQWIIVKRFYHDSRSWDSVQINFCPELWMFGLSPTDRAFTQVISPCEIRFIYLFSDRSWIKTLCHSAFHPTTFSLLYLKIYIWCSLLFRHPARFMYFYFQSIPFCMVYFIVCVL